MQNGDFISASSYIRALEKNLLTAAALARAAEAGSMSEVLRVLSQQSDYHFTSARPEACESILKDELLRVYTLVYALVPEACVADIPAAKYDFHNLKTAAKARFFAQRTPPPYIRASRYAPETLAAEIGNPSPTALRCALPPHLYEAAAAARAVFAEQGDPQSIDVTLDKLMFAHCTALAERTGNELILRHVRSMADFANVKLLLRAKAMGKGTAFLHKCLVPGGLTDPGFFTACYGKSPAAMAAAFFAKSFGGAAKKGFDALEKTGSLAVWERQLDDLLVDQLKAAKYVTYGPEVPYAYLLSKENELRQIRILITGRHNGVAPAQLRERLRDSYA